MNFYQQLENILFEENAVKKLALFETFYTEYKEGRIVFEKQYESKALVSPSYSSFCSIVPPQDVPKRKQC